MYIFYDFLYKYNLFFLKLWTSYQIAWIKLLTFYIKILLLWFFIFFILKTKTKFPITSYHDLVTGQKLKFKVSNQKSYKFSIVTWTKRAKIIYSFPRSLSMQVSLYKLRFQHIKIEVLNMWMCWWRKLYLLPLMHPNGHTQLAYSSPKRSLILMEEVVHLEGRSSPCKISSQPCLGTSTILFCEEKSSTWRKEQSI